MLTQTKEAGRYMSATKVIVVIVRASWIVLCVMVSVALLSWSAIVSRSWILSGLGSFCSMASGKPRIARVEAYLRGYSLCVVTDKTCVVH
jgi:hypothetical protein